MKLTDAVFDHIAEESRVLDSLRAKLPADATVEQKVAMREQAALLAAEATRRRVGVPMAAKVADKLSQPVCAMKKARANGRPARDVLTPKKGRGRKN